MNTRNYSITTLIIILLLTATVSLGAQDAMPLPQSNDGSVATRAAVYNEIMTNGSGEANFYQWRTKRANNSIKIACDNPAAGQFFAASGKCAFSLSDTTGGKETSVVKQIIRDSVDGFRKGDTLDVSFMGNSNSLNGVAQVQIVAKLNNGTKQKLKMDLNQGETSYQSYQQALVLKRKAKKIVVKLKLKKGTTGSAYIDRVSIAHITSPTCVVDQQDEQSWSYFVENTGSGMFASGRGPLPESQGSFMMATGSGNGQNLGGKVYMASNSLDGVRLDQIQNITYNTFVESSPNSSSALPAVNLYVDLDGDGTWYNNDPLSAILIFDPSRNMQNAIMTRSVWTTWRLDPSTTRWSDARGIVSSTTTPQATFKSILQYYPNAQIISPYPHIAPRFKGFQLVAGSANGGAWTNFVGYVDNVQFNTTGAVRCLTTDFEAYSPLN